MQVNQIKIEDIKPYANNPHEHTEEQIRHLVQLIQEYGFIIPMLLDKKNTIVAGHCKYEAAKRLGLEELPYITAENLSEEQVKAFRIADNKSIEGAFWDTEKLHQELKALEDVGYDLLHLGFSEKEINELVPEGPDFNFQDIIEDEAPEVQGKEPFSKLGDHWKLGRHHLLCGDSTSQKDVARLMNGTEAQLMITDPPYNIDYEGTDGQKIQNDNMSSLDFYNFLKAFYEAALEVMKPGASYYIFHADSETENFRKALEDAKFKFSQCLIWVKNNFNLSRQDYNWKHEPCLYGWKPGAAHYFIEDYTQDTVLESEENLKGMSKKELISYVRELQKALEEHSTVIRENKPLRNDVHPTMKPLKLLGRLILNSSKPGWDILDLFGGSASTLITCEQIDRTAYLMEFDPKYVDVGVKRYHNLGREDITLVRDGVEYPWDEIKEWILED